MLKSEGYKTYQNSKVMTASPAELTLMLYDGAIKFANIALSAIENNDIEKAHNNIRKADAIIEELQCTLNHKYPVADDFDKVYSYLRDRLMWANIKKDKDILNECLEHMHTMRDTWVQVMKNNKAGGTVVA
jgi:flagellar protein FliS